MIKSLIFFYRFYLRSSFIFQLIFVGCWLCAYLYMVNLHSIYESIGTATYMLNDDSTKTNIMLYGYGFVVLNVVQGTFILVFHCMQNEKVGNRCDERFQNVNNVISCDLHLYFSIDSTCISKIYSATFMAATVSFMWNWNDGW